jgi:hypothetical protein
VLFGAAILTRSEAGVLLLAALIVWKLATPSWRRFAGRSAPLVLAAVAAVAPWTVRNAITMHSFVPVVSGIGHTLLAGHQSDPYNPYHVFPEAKFQQQYKDLPFPQYEIKVEQASTREALKFIIHHPHDELLVFPFEKLFHLYRDDADALSWVRGARLPSVPAPQIYSVAVEDRWAALANGYYWVIMLAAIAGIPLWFSIRDKKRLLIILLVVGWTAAHLLFLPTPRYHSPLTPLFALWAAVTAVAVFDAIARRRAPARSSVGPAPDGEAESLQERNVDQSR